MIRCADYAAQRIFLYLYFMELHIKNMVCPRCIMAVEQVFTDMGIRPERVQLGVVMFNKELTDKQLSDASDKLEALGFTLLEDARNQLVEKIKSTIIEHIHHQGESSVPFSQVLSSALNRFQYIVQPVEIGHFDPVLLAGEESRVFLFLICRKVITGDIIDGKVLRFYACLDGCVVKLFLQHVNGNLIFVVIVFKIFLQGNIDVNNVRRYLFFG